MTTHRATLVRNRAGWDAAPAPSPRSAVAAVMTVALVALTAVAAGLAAWPDHGGEIHPTPAVTGGVRSSDVSIAAISYAVGQSSGWHVHPGVHAIFVTAGTLTVYDAACEAHTFGPGDTYVSGQDVHLARNETAATVELIVTTIEPAIAADSVLRRPPPATCETLSRGAY